ncbi:MAG: hypothetical protein R2725_09560 [Solirubrobacterales bacterium]
MTRFRAAYGASPLHLLAVIASFAIAAYGFLRITESPSPASTLIYFAAAVVAHDLLAFPFYSALNLVAGRALAAPGRERATNLGVAPLNYVRVPFILSGIAFLLFFPLILGLGSERYEDSTGYGVGVFLNRWLLLCGVLFAASALLYAIRLRLAASGEGD